ncbi:MAG TPA: ATP-grasp domain-containing protein [Actinomycetota bacterium]|nr:ATP-grasp domain-containing protein [Actinomycetota bacterium]
MNILFLSPGFPAEMPFFTRGLAQVGAKVIGLGDQNEAALPSMARQHLSAYLKADFSDVRGLIAMVEDAARLIPIHRVECMWEPLMILAAQLREHLGLPGLTVEETIPFRDKEKMKQVLDAAGIRTPRHARATTADECRSAAEMIGFPLIVKPIAGAGSADTYRVDDWNELEAAIPKLRRIPQISVEEFIDAEEFTFDTICFGGEVLFYNICAYRPRPLISRILEWVSPITTALRNPDVPYLAEGKRMGWEVLKAMNFKDGFTHMEWFLKPDGEAVFGEIGGRPPGARTVDIMNFSVDADLFSGWAEAITTGHISQDLGKKYNAASMFKRAQGEGRITRIEGLGRLMADYGEHVVELDLLPLGAPRRNWMQTLISDGTVMVRHPDLATTIEMIDRFATDLQIYAE